MIIKAENITKDYNRNMRALKGGSLEIPSGVYGLIGRNGARYILKVISTTSAPTNTGIKI